MIVPKREVYAKEGGGRVVPGVGLEPTRLAAGDFESPTSTNFITRARGRVEYYDTGWAVGRECGGIRGWSLSVG